MRSNERYESTEVDRIVEQRRQLLRMPWEVMTPSQDFLGVIARDDLSPIHLYYF